MSASVSKMQKIALILKFTKSGFFCYKPFGGETVVVAGTDDTDHFKSIPDAPNSEVFADPIKTSGDERAEIVPVVDKSQVLNFRRTH